MVANITAVGSPDRAKGGILGMILGILWSNQAVFAVREPLCGVRIPS